MNEQPFATGSCRCGAITLTITGKPRQMIQCHCLDCQKTSGTGHASNAYFSRDDVTISGELTGHSVTADSGSIMTRYFCPACGSRMCGDKSGQPELISVPVGALDDHSWFRPQVVLFSSRRKNWDITSDEVPNFDGMPPG